MADHSETGDESAALPDNDSSPGWEEIVDSEPEVESGEDEAPLPNPPAPYAYDPLHAVIAGEVLDRAFSRLHDGPGGWGLVEEVVTEHGGVDEGLARELSAIGGRELSLKPRNGTPDCSFTTDVHWLPNPKDVPDEVAELWRETLKHATHPAAVARLEELLLARRDGHLVSRARSAASNYLAAVAGEADDLTTSIYLTRAWTLARLFNQADIEDQVLDELEARVTPASTPYMGVILPMIAILCCDPTNSARKPGLHSTAERILAELAQTQTTSHIVFEIADLRRKLVPPGSAGDTKRTEIRADEMSALRRAAELHGLEPLVKQSFLTDAARFATRHNLHEDLKEIRLELEKVSRGDLGLKRISTATDIPAWFPEHQLSSFTRGDTWHNGLRYFLLTPPPTGDVEDVRKSASNMPGVFRHLMDTVLLGRDGLPRTTISTPEEKREHDMSQYAQIATQSIGQIYALGLYRIAKKYGAPAEDELTAFLIEAYKCEPEAASVLAKAFGHFWEDNYLEVAYLAAPATEDAARRLLRELDEGAYRVQVGKNPGKYPGLGVLLDELLRLGLDPSWHYYLTWLLLGPIGANIRNDVAHGFTKTMDPIHAALTLRAAAVLILATGSVTEEGKRIGIRARPAPRAGLLGAGARVLDRVSAALLRGHVFFEGVRSGRIPPSP